METCFVPIFYLETLKINEVTFIHNKEHNKVKDTSNKEKCLYFWECRPCFSEKVPSRTTVQILDQNPVYLNAVVKKPFSLSKNKKVPNSTFVPLMYVKGSCKGNVDTRGGQCDPYEKEKKFPVI